MSNTAQQATDVANPVIKTGAVVGGAVGAKAVESAEQAGNFFGIMSWADFAAAVAAGYTLCLWGQLLWKSLLRPYLESKGWVRRAQRRRSDIE